MSKTSVLLSLSVTLCLSTGWAAPTATAPAQAPDNAQPLPDDTGASPGDPNLPKQRGEYEAAPDRLRIQSDELDPDLKRIHDALKKSHPHIPSHAVKYAFTYLDTHEQEVTNKDFVTIIDFTLPSSKKRMHVINMKTVEVSSYLVTHGKNSGLLYATRFSNINGSYMSSLGIYLTGVEYQGSNGRSMRLHGMESTNSNAFDRDIVFHGASYATEAYVKKHKRLGLSLGCPAVDHQYKDLLIDQLGEGSILYIFREPKRKG